MAGVVAANEPVLARVLSINEAGGQMVLFLDDAGDGDRRLVLPLPKDGRTHVGDLLRVWPGADRSQPARVTPLYSDRLRRDPTGVRSRLMRDPRRDRGHSSGGRRGR